MRKHLSTAVTVLAVALLAGLFWWLIRVDQRLSNLEGPHPEHIAYGQT